MADEIKYPVGKFYFEVSWEGTDNAYIICSEVSGLNSTIENIEYRDGKSEAFYPTKRPGLQKFDDVVLTKAIFENDQDFKAWHDIVATDRKDYRKTVVISLGNEVGMIVMTWELQNAWVSKWEMPDMNSTANEVAIDKITVVCENIETTIFGG